MKIYPLYIVLTVIFLFGVPFNASGAEMVTEEVFNYRNGKNVSGYVAGLKSIVIFGRRVLPIFFFGLF